MSEPCLLVLEDSPLERAPIHRDHVRGARRLAKGCHTWAGKEILQDRSLGPLRNTAWRMTVFSETSTHVDQERTKDEAFTSGRDTGRMWAAVHPL